MSNMMKKSLDSTDFLNGEIEARFGTTDVTPQINDSPASTTNTSYAWKTAPITQCMCISDSYAWKTAPITQCMCVKDSYAWKTAPITQCMC